MDDLRSVADEFDVLIDFTSPSALQEHLKVCRQFKHKLVIGTTGLAAEDREMIRQYAEDMAILESPNMSYGVNLCVSLLSKIAQMTATDEVDIEILETHHRFKKDAPSGTAIRMGEAVAEGRGVQAQRAFSLPSSW